MENISGTAAEPEMTTLCGYEIFFIAGFFMLVRFDPLGERMVVNGELS